MANVTINKGTGTLTATSTGTATYANGLATTTLTGTGTSNTATAIGTTSMDDIFNSLFGSFNSSSSTTNKTSKPCVNNTVKTILNFPAGIKTVHINEKKKVVTVVLESGSKGIARCHDHDEFDPFVGFCVAFTYALFSTRTKALKWFKGKTGPKDKKKKKETK